MYCSFALACFIVRSQVFAPMLCLIRIFPGRGPLWQFLWERSVDCSCREPSGNGLSFELPYQVLISLTLALPWPISFQLIVSMIGSTLVPGTMGTIDLSPLAFLCDIV